MDDDTPCPCEGSCRGPIHGAIWPMGTNCDHSLPFIERCDECYAAKCPFGFYESDDEAAEAIATTVGERVQHAPAFGLTFVSPWVWHPHWRRELRSHAALVPPVDDI